jgi:predicted ATPase
MLTMATETPYCVVVEDLHWLDPTSCELLETLVRELPGHRMLLLLTGRESCAPDWSGKVQTALRLGPLTLHHAAEMMHGIIGRDLVEHLARKVVERTDGVPLFVEEVARLLQAQPEYGDELFASVEGLIPASLDESLMARLGEGNCTSGRCYGSLSST